MDIFEKIENGISSRSSKTALGVVPPPRFEWGDDRRCYIVNVQYNENCLDSGLYAYIPREFENCLKTNFIAEKTAKKTFGLLMKLRDCSDKKKNKIVKKIKKLLKKGVNFKKYFSKIMCKQVVAWVPEDVIELIYKYGFDVKTGIVAGDTCNKNIYHLLSNKDFEISSYSLIKRTPVHILEKILTARRDLKISIKTVDGLVDGLTNRLFYDEELNRYLEILFKNGAVSFTAQQIKQICNCSRASRTDCPTIFEAYDQLTEGTIGGLENDRAQMGKEQTIKTQNETPESVIDKIFKEAQNSIE